MQQNTPTTFDNASDAMLADAIGDLDSQIKAIKARLYQAKSEFLSRGLGRIHGGRFSVTKSEAVRWTLDATAVKQEMGEAWVTARSRQTHVTSLRVTVNKAALAAAE